MARLLGRGRREFVVFIGRIFDFLLLCLTNAVFTLLSVGIYSFWAKVKVKSFLAEHTFFMNEPFAYRATGGERLRGFLKALPWLLGLYILLFIVVEPQLIYTLRGWGHAQVEAAVYSRLFVYVLVGLLWLHFWPEVHVGQRRFEMSRLNWRNLPFAFRGTAAECFYIYFGGAIAVLIGLVVLAGFSAWLGGLWELLSAFFRGSRIGTYFKLGVGGFILFAPGVLWMRWQLRRFDIEHTWFGSERFSFNGTLAEYCYLALRGYFLSLITFGLYYPCWWAETHNYFWSNTSFQGRRLCGCMSLTSAWAARCLGLLITAVTFGFGRPIAAFLNQRLIIESVYLDGPVSLVELQRGADTNASALQSGFADAVEAVGAVADFF